MMKSAIKLLTPFLIIAARVYWYIFKPKTFGAKVVITNNGSVLLVKTTYGYKLTLPGGGIKKGELPKDAAKREVSEELGLTLHNVRSLGSIVSTAEYKVDTVYAFHAEIADRNITIDTIEIEYVEWQPLETLVNAGPVTLELINLYKNKKSLSIDGQAL